MSHPPPDADDPDMNPGNYGFSEPAPPKREAPPLKYDKYATREPDPEDDPADDDEPRPKKRKKRRDLAFEPPPDPADDPLTRPKPWWFWTVVLTVAGLVGLIVAVVMAGTSFKGAAIALVGAVVGVVVATAVVAVLMVVIGVAFGIDYGPVNQAIVKLFGCIAFVNGFTLGFGMVCYSCIGLFGILIAIASITLVSFAVFQSQFKLSMYEALVTVLTIQGSAWLMATGLGFAFMRVK